MKKSLFATTAIVAAAAAVAVAPQQAAAQDDGGISLDVGGYYEFYYTLSSQDTPDNVNDDYRSDRVRSEGEIEFSGETTLDNGINVGINVQLEAYTTGDQIDEHYAFVEGSFGRFQIGAENSAPYAMHYAAPAVGIAVNSPDYRPFATPGGNYATNTFVGGSSDANKLTYFTPRFAGVQFGASYAPDTQNTSGASQGTGLILDESNVGGRAYGAGINYVQSFNGIDVAASGGYELIEDDSPAGTVGVTGNTLDDRDEWSLGLNLGYAGFTVGGSYNQTEQLNGIERDVYDIGVAYNTGPWGASLTWLHGETEVNNGTGDEDTHDSAVLGLTYALGTGITANANLHYIALDGESANAGTANDYDDDAFAASAGLMLSF
jgi:predicted porin